MTLHQWNRRHEVNAAARQGVTSDERQCVKAREREVKKLRRANEILKLASAFFASVQVLRKFVGKHHHTHGVEPICKVLQIAPSGYRRHVCQQRALTLYWTHWSKPCMPASRMKAMR